MQDLNEAIEKMEEAKVQWRNVSFEIHMKREGKLKENVHLQLKDYIPTTTLKVIYIS